MDFLIVHFLKNGCLDCPVFVNIGGLSLGVVGGQRVGCVCVGGGWGVPGSGKVPPMRRRGGPCALGIQFRIMCMAWACACSRAVGWYPLAPLWGPPGMCTCLRLPCPGLLRATWSCNRILGENGPTTLGNKFMTFCYFFILLRTPFVPTPLSLARLLA